MGADGKDHEAEQDVEDLARRLFALETKGVDAWGLELLPPEKRSNFFKSWGDMSDSTRRAYRQRARRVIADRHNDDNAGR
ncbi:hypothetical protein [Flexivirga sp. B27]